MKINLCRFQRCRLYNRGGWVFIIEFRLERPVRIGEGVNYICVQCIVSTYRTIEFPVTYAQQQAVVENIPTAESYEQNSLLFRLQHFGSRSQRSFRALAWNFSTCALGSL